MYLPTTKKYMKIKKVMSADNIRKLWAKYENYEILQRYLWA